MSLAARSNKHQVTNHFGRKVAAYHRKLESLNEVLMERELEHLLAREEFFDEQNTLCGGRSHCVSGSG